MAEKLEENEQKNQKTTSEFHASCMDLENKFTIMLNNLHLSEFKTRNRFIQKQQQIYRTINDAERNAVDSLDAVYNSITQRIEDEFQKVELLFEKKDTANLEKCVSQAVSKIGAFRTELKFVPSESIAVVLKTNIPKLGEVSGRISGGISKKCNANNCSTCRYMIETDTFTSNATRETFPINKTMTCTTSNVVYLITCQQCNLQFVGETHDTLQKEIDAHVFSWQKQRINESPVAAHFLRNDHSLDHLRIVALDYYSEIHWKSSNKRMEKTEWINMKRKEAEQVLINKLNTLSPFGMNQDDKFQRML